MPMWIVKTIKKTYPQRFMLAKLTKAPGIGRLIKKMLFEGDDMMFLARDSVITVGESIDEPAEIVLPSEVVEHFINEANYHWIMDTCICREGENCEDYPHDLGCLFLGETAMGINPKQGKRVTREQALEHERRCREAGLIHLIGRNKLDTVWLNVRPGEKLMTVCNCCPCCCLWRILPVLSGDISSKVTRMPGVEVTVTEACVGCGTCTENVCIADAITRAGDRAVISEECRGCGRCVDVCPEGAIKLEITDEGFVQEAIDRITPLVDIS